MAKIEDCPGFETFGADVKAARKAKQLSRKIPAVTMYHVSQRTAGKLLCLSCCLDIRAERFKAGTVLNFRHSASPIYIL